MIYISIDDYNALHNDFKGVWDTDHINNTKYNGKRTMTRFIENRGTCLLIEGVSFEIVELDQYARHEAPCEECDGNGYYEVMDCHVGSASLCCGGCYKNVECEECEGSGTQMIDYEPI